jgi:hypothetical protein
MRAQIANFEDGSCGECPYWPCPTRDMTKKFCLLEVDQLLSLVREEIKKVENPYPDRRGYEVQRAAFEEGRNDILKALEEK